MFMAKVKALRYLLFKYAILTTFNYLNVFKYIRNISSIFATVEIYIRNHAVFFAMVRFAVAHFAVGHFAVRKLCRRDPCMQNTEETIAKYSVDANLFRLGSTNPKEISGPRLFW